MGPDTNKVNDPSALGVSAVSHENPHENRPEIPTGVEIRIPILENPIISEDSQESGVNWGMEEIADLQYKASYYDMLQEENVGLRKRMDVLSTQLEKALQKKPPEETPEFQNAVLVKIMNEQMQELRKDMQSQMQAMQKQMSGSPRESDKTFQA